MKKILFVLLLPASLFGMGFSEFSMCNPIIEISCRAELRKAFVEAELGDVAESVKIYQSFSNNTQITKMYALSIITGVDFCCEAWAIHNHESPDFDKIRKKKGALIRVLCASNQEWISLAEKRSLFEEVHVKNIYD